MTAIAEAKEALRRLEQDLSAQITRFQDETGLTISYLNIEHTEVTTGQDQAAGRRQFLTRVRPRAEVVG